MDENIKYIILTVVLLTIIFTILLSPNKQQPIKAPDPESEKESCSRISIESDVRSLPVDNQYKVPNIVHYLWYKDTSVELRFDQALSALSAIKFIKPEAVYFHTNKEPTGEYYRMLKRNPLFKVIHRDPSIGLIQTLAYNADYSNFDKVKILTEEGGIYLDLDQMVVQPFDELRKYDCTVGLEKADLVSTGVILCVKGYPFLYLWLNSFFDDYGNKWHFNNQRIATCLVNKFRGLVHIEHDKFHSPSLSEPVRMWGNVTFPWQKNYAVHTSISTAVNHWIKDYPTPESIRTMNNTYGQIARRVYYESSNNH